MDALRIVDLRQGLRQVKLRRLCERQDEDVWFRLLREQRTGNEEGRFGMGRFLGQLQLQRNSPFCSDV